MVLEPLDDAELCDDEDRLPVVPETEFVDLVDDMDPLPEALVEPVGLEFLKK